MSEDRRGAEIILEKVGKVSSTNFPEIASRVSLTLPGEKTAAWGSPLQRPACP
jgi:hypothetical protein